MLDYKQQFIKLAIDSKVLRFGEFTLKSGRKSPYFFNSGLFNSGATMLAFSRFFAASIEHADIDFDVLFGPAYKGITLSCATAMALAENSKQAIPFAYNRKEVKSHGEGGATVGADVAGKVAIIDDVITAGTAIREAIAIIKANQAQPCAIFLALDRQEVGLQPGLSAVKQVEKEFSIPVVAIATLDDLIEYLAHDKHNATPLQNMVDYREQYGCS